ncbi:hypothetical protein [Streptomyces glaucus]|uniref:DUF2637 domain-containing protein n=1 Tax=Streptomyces glaucus TaxID=284029 RepID=A0ABP5X589_9ACTN
MFSERGTGRHRGPSEPFPQPLVPPDWDPAEELAFMLQDAMAEHAPHIAPHVIPPVTPHAAPQVASPHSADDGPVAAPAPGTPLENLQEITAELPPLKGSPRGHRRARERGGKNGLRTVSHLIAAVTALIACSVSFFGGMVAYAPLRLSAVPRAEGGIAAWWPLLIYGPWLVSSLSVLRAALHQRRAVHAWCVVLFFSSVAMMLCVVQAPRTVVDTAAAALPGLASLACFQQLVRQITLTRPPRRTMPRHRVQAAAAAQVPAQATAQVQGPASVPTPAPAPAPGPAPSQGPAPAPREQAKAAPPRPGTPGPGGTWQPSPYR